jgi:hypothetical protein
MNNLETAESLAVASDRVAEGHTADCNIYPDFQGTCDCGYDKAIVDTLDVIARVEEQARVVSRECQAGGPWSLRINHLLNLILGTPGETGR